MSSVGQRSMAQSLADRDDGWLRALLAVRPDLADPAPTGFVALAARASTPPSIAAARQRLDEFCLQLLDTLCLLPEPTEVPAVLGLLGARVDRADVERGLGTLVDRALAFRHDDAVRAHPTVHQLVSFPAGLGPPLAELLGRQTAAELGRLAANVGAQPGRNKAASLAAVVSMLADPATVQQLVAAGPSGTAALTYRLAAESPLLATPYGYYAPPPHTPLGWLVSRGLVVAINWGQAVMPREVGLALRGGTPYPTLRARPPDLARTPVDTDDTDRVGADRALQLVRDLVTVLDEFAVMPPRLLKAGGIGIREVRRAAKDSGRSERDAARLLELTAVAGLLGPDWPAQVAVPRSGYDDWLALDSPARWVHLAEAWLACPRHVSMAGSIGETGKPLPPIAGHGADSDAPRQRGQLLALLLAGEGRVPEQELRDRLVWDEPLLWAGGPDEPGTVVGWLLQEAELLGVASSGTLTAFGRLIARGEPAAGALARHAPPVTEEFVVQADLTAVAAGELSAPVRTELELVADVESTGSATVYRFSEASVRRGFDAGRSEGEIQAFLQRHARRGVPQALRYLISDLGRRFGRVRVGPARCFLRVDDPALAAEVLCSRKLAPLGLRQIAPTVLVAQAETAALVEALRAAGHLPAHEGADGALVVSRLQPRRIGGGPGGYGQPARLPQPPDHGKLAAVVDQLREGGVSAAGPPSVPQPGRRLTVVPESAQMPLVLAEEELGDELPRPTFIAHGAEMIRELVECAGHQQWGLRLCLAGADGALAEVNVMVLERAGDVIVAECPDGQVVMCDIGEIAWARVLTCPEEELLLL